MAGVAIEGSLCSGHDGYPSRNSIEGDASFTVNGVAVHCDGMNWAMHSKPDNPPHGGVGIGSQPFTINGAPVCIVGDAVSCGSVIISGDDSFQIG